jgi:catechol 2,3-dioxygenase-like lactoylglutathione lyase family enzyme
VNESVIPVLRVADAARAVAWYERLGFRKEGEHQFEPGFPLFVALRAGPAMKLLANPALRPDRRS